MVQLADQLHVCPVGRLERLYSARTSVEYDEWAEALLTDFRLAPAPSDIFERTLKLQRDLAHHHGLWHRISLADLLIAEVALFNDLGVLHVDRDFDRIAEVRPLTVRRLRL